MKVRFIVFLSLVSLAIAFILAGCSSKAINYDSALQKYEAQNYQKALTEFEEIAKGSSKFAPRAEFYAGECYKYLFRFDEAVAAFQKVGEKSTDPYLSAEAKNRLAQIREGRNDVERLKITHANYPGTDQAADALLELGSVYDNKLNDYKTAIETYNQLIKEFPGSSKAAQAQISIGYIYLYKLFDYNTAFAEFNKVNIKTYPELKFRVSEVEDLLRNVNKTRGEIAEHVAFIDQTQRQDYIPGRKITAYDLYGAKKDQVAQSFHAIAVKWRSLKNYPQAMNAYRMLIERLPMEQAQASEARFGIAEIYMAQSRYYEAVEAFQNFIKFHPTNYRRPEAIYQMAIAYEALRDYDMAYKTYVIYRDTYPDKDNFKAAELKVRQYEYDEDQDGAPYYKELQAGTSDKDPSKRPS